MITSPRNPKLKDVRRFYRGPGDEAVLEGPHLVAEALALGLPFETVVATADLAGSQDGAALIAALPRPPLLVAPETLAGITDADSPRGILAVVRLPRRSDPRWPAVHDAVYLYVEGIQDPGNLGALARVAEAAGVAGLACSPGCAHPNHPRALRASAGSLLRLPVARDLAPADLDRRCEGSAPRWLLLDAHDGTGLYEIDAEGPLVLAVGSEGAGPSDRLRSHAAARVTIPLAPPVESLNVATAAAVALFEIRRRRHGGHPGSAIRPASPR